jgi:hypothetical protein
VPNCKSFLVTEAEKKHVRRRARFQQHRDASCQVPPPRPPQGKAPKEIVDLFPSYQDMHPRLHNPHKLPKKKLACLRCCSLSSGHPYDRSLPVAESENCGCGLDPVVRLIHYLLLPLYAGCYKKVSCYNSRQFGAK